MIDSLRDMMNVVSVFVIPLMLAGVPIYGLYKKVPVYEAFVAGAKEGFTIAVTIIPYLVAILFAIGLFRASGALEVTALALSPILGPLGIDPELLPMAMTRPLTGSGSFGVLAETAEVHGTGSIITKVSAIMYGSTETTFYVLAVYFGAVGVKKTRHAVAAGLIADFAAILLAIYVGAILLG